MNVIESNVLRTIIQHQYTNQREVAELSGYSLGSVNRAIKGLLSKGMIDEHGDLTPLAMQLKERNTPQNAIILAAGFGMRMVPINLSTPKALLEVNGERLIERVISQLHEVGVTNITVVVGFMMDSFEYLIDEFGVDLVVNEEYATRNNLHSLALVADRIHNTYIMPCDIWCDVNPFDRTELYSWYMVSDLLCEDSSVRINRKMELVKVGEKESGNAMIGISYLLEPEASIVRERLHELDDKEHASFFWEQTIYNKDRMILQAKVMRSSNVVEINTYEQLRELDPYSSQLKSDAIKVIADVLKCKEQDVINISVLKKGMTNRSFLFSVAGKKYIMRIPGEGTDQLIDRRHEAEVFGKISGLGLCDDPIYIDPKTGYKITSFLDGVRTCDSESIADLTKCMKKLKQFHDLKLVVSHTFDLFGQIDFYESLWEGDPSIFRDYSLTKAHVIELKDYIEKTRTDWCLTHIDAVADNFLFYSTPQGEALQLTDWEYSGMQDPHVDIAMFCIYSLYNKKNCDRLINLYFDGNCERSVRAKIYCYIAICGLLWSNWCEYKRKLGVEFGEYSLRQYRYAKDYYKYAKELIDNEEV